MIFTNKVLFLKQLDGSLMDSPSCQSSSSLAPLPRAAVTSCNPDKWKLQQQCEQLEVYEPGTKCTFEVTEFLVKELK